MITILAILFVLVVIGIMFVLPLVLVWRMVNDRGQHRVYAILGLFGWVGALVAFMVVPGDWRPQ